MFYTYLPQSTLFIVASAEETTHIRHILNNPQIAGNILLETHDVEKIQGVQFRGVFSKLDDVIMEAKYYDAFPYARDMKPALWKIDIESFKMTDNSLGFGKKIIWKGSSH